MTPVGLPRGFMIGIYLEMPLAAGFAAFVGIDHAILFVVLSGVLLVGVISNAVSKSASPDSGQTKAEIAQVVPRALGSIWQTVVLAAVIVAVLSLLLGPETVHEFARNLLGFDTFMTMPLL